MSAEVEERSSHRDVCEDGSRCLQGCRRTEPCFRSIAIHERYVSESQEARRALISDRDELASTLREHLAEVKDGVVRLTHHDRQMLTDAADFISDYGKGALDFQGTRVALRAIVERANAVEPVPPESDPFEAFWCGPQMDMRRAGPVLEVAKACFLGGLASAKVNS